MEKEDLAYIAAFIDGEGTITAQRHTRKDGIISLYPRIVVYNQDIEPLIFIQQNFGGKIYHTRTVYQWFPTGVDVIAMLKTLLLYFKVRHKIERANFIIHNLQGLSTTNIVEEWDALLLAHKTWHSNWASNS